MPDVPGEVKRPYRSARRREQAEQTRQRVLDAADTVFRERGYDRATIAMIAAAAEVADETVYAHFGNKRTLLGALVERAVRGEDSRPVPEQEAPRAVTAATDQREQLRLFAADIVKRLDRVAPLIAVVNAAAPAEPELADLLDLLHAQRLRNLRTVVDALAANGPLRLSRAAATEAVWALASPELYKLLIDVRRWSRRRYAEWLAANLGVLLLPA
jgi:AcrR family transcriptional regulator